MINGVNPDRFNGFRVRTTRDDGKITTVVDLLRDNEVAQRINTAIVDIQEIHVRDSLVTMGWTPPEE